MTIASHELALYEINTGSRYDRRCRIVRYPASSKAACMLDVAKDAAREYSREFGDPGDQIFSAEDLLLCAVELVEYYDQHVAEMDTVA